MQLIHDVVNASESTHWSSVPTSIAKYNALKCQISALNQDHHLYEQTEELIDTRNR